MQNRTRIRRYRPGNPNQIANTAGAARGPYCRGNGAFADTLADTYDQGYRDGYSEGFNDGRVRGCNECYTQGVKAGYVLAKQEILKGICMRKCRRSRCCC